MYSPLPTLFISNSRSLTNKIDELTSTVTAHSADVAVITETWLSENVPCAVIDLHGFSVLRRDRSDGRRGGGVRVYVKEHLPLIHLKEPSNPDFESLWLLLITQRLPRGLNSIILSVVYHPPGNDDIALQSHITECLDLILSSHPNSGIILTAISTS